jgi:protein-serine/threonine kinase
MLTPRRESIHEPVDSATRMTPQDFEMVSTLGSGAFGEVYQVKKVDSGHIYAMKLLDKEKYFKDKLLKYAISERNVLCMLKHPFITQLHYAFQTAEKLVLIMEYCAGGDLSRQLFRRKRYEELPAHNIICEVILALEELHNHNIIYRDLKPENILFDSQGHIKITDFGLSKEMPEENLMARTFCGTISYIAPEVIKRKGYTKAIDWYTVGVVFYEMLEGKTPFAGGKREQTIKNIMHATLKFSRVKSPALKDLLERLMVKNPLERLGANGAGEIKSHPYFSGVNWESVYRRELEVELPEVSAGRIKQAPKADRIFGTEESKTKRHVEEWSFINR